MCVKAPSPHQWLDRHVEGALGLPFKPERSAYDGLQIGAGVKCPPAGAPVQLHEVACGVEEREMLLHSPQFRECGLRCGIALIVGAGKELQVHRLPHRPGPPLDESDGRAGGQTDCRNQCGCEAATESCDKLPAVHRSTDCGAISSRRTKNDWT